MKKSVITLIIVVAVIAIVILALGMTGQIVGGVPKGCIDSDGGKDYFVKGEIHYNNRDVSYEDYCTFSGKKVNEYYCHSDNQIKSLREECENGCVDGVCIE